MKNDPVYIFANKVAKAFKEHRSSHVVFFIQQAYGEDLYETSDWSGLEELLDNIITLSDLDN